jgi:hypothetical protein
MLYTEQIIAEGDEQVEGQSPHCGNDDDGANEMLTQRARTKLIDDINTGFASLGLTVGKMPRSTKNNEGAAWEYWIASHLYTLAKARREEAKKSAIASGVFFDDEDPAKWRQPGTNDEIFRGNVVSIGLKVSKPRYTLDKNALVASLLNDKVSKTVIGRALDSASKEGKPGHAFTAIVLAK